jgi:hypothetical protein
VSDFQCQQILRDNYCRLQVEFPESTTIDMDDTSQMRLMSHLANSQKLATTVGWLRRQKW